MVQQVDDGILNSQLGLMGKLEGVEELTDHGSELSQDKSPQGLHDVSVNATGP